MLFDLALVSSRSFDLVLCQPESVASTRTDSGLKVDLSGSKKYVLRAKKHMLFRTRVVHFWTRIWPGRDDGNTNNRDGGKGRCPDRLLAYIILKREVLLKRRRLCLKNNGCISLLIKKNKNILLFDQLIS